MITTRRNIMVAGAVGAIILSGHACAVQTEELFSIGLFDRIVSPVIPAGTRAVQTQGYCASGEGAAAYVQDDAADATYRRQHQSSTFVAADGRCFRLRKETRVDPRSLGLRIGLGRGFAVENARAILDALALGNSIVLPSGDIDLTNAGDIALPARDGITIAGQGWSTRLVTSTTAFMVPTLSHLEIRDLWIEQTGVGGAAIQSFHANLRNIRLLRLKITMRNQAVCHENCISIVLDDSQVGVDGLVGLKGLLIENCWLAPGRMGVEIQNHRVGDDKTKLYAYRDVTIRGCTIWKAPAFAGMGISLTGWGIDCLISSNRFVACNGPNVEIVGSDQTTVADNVFEDAIGSPIAITNFRVVGRCRILRNRTTGRLPSVALFIQSVDGAEVAGNVLGTTGTIVIKGFNVHIHDNVFTGIGTAGMMQLDNARNVMVEKNRFVSTGVAFQQAMIIAFNDTRDCTIRFNRMERAENDVRRSDHWFFQAPPARGSLVYGNERRGHRQRLDEPMPLSRRLA